MQAIVSALAEQHDELASLVDGLDDHGWRHATPCEGWDVAAVVLHLAQSDEIAIASAAGRFSETIDALGGGDAAAGSVDDGVERLVASERASEPSAIHDRWRRSAAALRDALLHLDPHTRVRWVAGDMAARTLATTRLAETWIHTQDVAAGLDVELEPPERIWHIARLAWRTVPYAFEREGGTPPAPVAFRLTGPDGTPWDLAPEGDAPNVITGDAYELCLVAARRVPWRTTSLRGEGPDADAILDMVRTWA